MNLPLHLLNGDQLASQLQGASFFQSQLVFREALIVGPVTSSSLDEFWKTRTEFISTNYGVTAEEYRQKTILEIERLHSLPEDTEICLWFEDDLFCQLNLWFLLSLLADRPKFKLCRVFPPTSTAENRWGGFGRATPNSLQDCYQARVPLAPSDLTLGKALWQAYSTQDWDVFKRRSLQSSPSFQLLVEVCQAQLDRLPGSDGLGKPERILNKILAGGVTDFHQLFQEFNRQAGIYGFGDMQVKAMLDSLIAGKR
ncbi:MAG: DUF1835 domain-containing protein [Bacteroidetes bacterium]|nr:DUF1835 domain-containing protein [Bacteroidota bacterium]